MEATKTPLTFLERLIDEKDQLGEKISKLQSFIESDNYQKIDSQQRDYLCLQLLSMQSYFQCLMYRKNLLESN
jgi:hypothetical protein